MRRVLVRTYTRISKQKTYHLPVAQAGISRRTDAAPETLAPAAVVPISVGSRVLVTSTLLPAAATHPGMAGSGDLPANGDGFMRLPVMTG